MPALCSIEEASIILFKNRSCSREWPEEFLGQLDSCPPPVPTPNKMHENGGHLVMPGPESGIRLQVSGPGRAGGDGGAEKPSLLEPQDEAGSVRSGLVADSAGAGLHGTRSHHVAGCPGWRQEKGGQGRGKEQ